MPEEQIKKELVRIDFLLRNKEFSFEIAKAISMAYDEGKTDAVPFISSDEETALVSKSVKEEKIAMNLAGFYALECGVGVLCEITRELPVQWLQKITDKAAGPEAVLLLNRFANATWKAGQPFRSLERISRFCFTGAGFLEAEEVKKDLDQITSAAAMLLLSMKEVSHQPLPEQMEKLKSLLQDTGYAFEMAKNMEASYYLIQHQAAPLFLTPADETAVIQKSVKEQKIATNIAGFYALECGINYFVTTKQVIPSDVLKSILNDTISEADKTIFLRFANATWKAGQPFLDLKRITRDTFKPAYFLTREDIEKDMVQIKAAARKLLEALSG